MNTVIADRPHSWRVAGLLLDAITRRNFTALENCLDERVTLRALLPSGSVELHGAEDVASTFRTWFGGDEQFEVADAALGQLGSKLYARWRIRMWPAGAPARARVAEQHVFTSGETRITCIDLLCSGFQQDEVGQ